MSFLKEVYRSDVGLTGTALKNSLTSAILDLDFRITRLSFRDEKVLFFPSEKIHFAFPYLFSSKGGDSRYLLSWNIYGRMSQFENVAISYLEITGIKPKLRFDRLNFEHFDSHAALDIEDILFRFKTHSTGRWECQNDYHLARKGNTTLEQIPDLTLDPLVKRLIDDIEQSKGLGVIHYDL